MNYTFLQKRPLFLYDKVSNSSQSLDEVVFSENYLENSRGLLIFNLSSDKIYLKNAPLFIDRDVDEDGNIIYSNSDLEIFGYGDTDEEARADFEKVLEDLYICFNQEKEKNNLHNNAIPLWNLLDNILKEK